MLNAVRFVIPRISEDGEVALAIVEARVDPKYEAKSAFKQRLIEALTKWRDATDEGKKAWEDSVQNFNVADLENYVNAYSWEYGIDDILVEYGIHELNVEIYYGLSPGVWNYDDILMEEDE
jgi:hypothetical protein